MTNAQYEEIEEVAQRPFNWAYLKRMLGYARPYRRQLILVTLVVAIGSMLRLTEPYLLRTAIDEGITGRNLAVIDRIALLWLLFQLIGAISDHIRIRVLNTNSSAPFPTTYAYVCSIQQASTSCSICAKSFSITCSGYRCGSTMVIQWGASCRGSRTMWRRSTTSSTWGW